MILIKNGEKMVTTDETVIRAFKQNGYEEQKAEEKPKTPKKSK